MKKTFLHFFFCLFILVMNFTTLAQTTIVEWNFPNNPDDSLADGGIPPNALKIISPVGITGSITYPAGVTSQSISTTGWTGGQDTKYWLIEFSTVLYNQLTVSSRQQSSNTGPKDFKIQYRIGTEGIWTDLSGATSIVVANNFTSGVVNEVPLPVECDEQPSVFLRWIMTSNTNVNNGVVAGGGTSRVDDIIIESALNEPLPVELTSFTAAVLNQAIHLHWQTATETNNFGFEIERVENNSDNLNEWTKIGFKEGNGNSNSLKDYSFIDNNVNSNTKYSYRLKQIDVDGTFEYSKVIEVSSQILNGFELSQNYPNPFNPLTTVQFSIATPSYVSLVLYNSLGEELKVILEQNLEAGIHKIKLDASELTSGVYFYSLKTKDVSIVRKMLVVK